MRRIVLILFVLLSVCLCNAQDADSTWLRVYDLDGIEVISSRSEVHAGAAIPVQSFSHTRMVKLGIGSMAELLRHIAGITVRDYGGAGGMKTVSVRGMGSQHTAVIYDGFALGDCQTGEIDLSRYSLTNMSSFSMHTGDKELLLQPARNMASAASLSIYSLHSPLSTLTSPPSSVGITLGSWGMTSPSFSFTKNFAHQLTLNAQGEYTYAENDYPFTLRNVNLTTRERRTNSRMTSGHGEINMDWRINEANTLTSKIYYYDNRRQLPGIVHLYTAENDETLHEKTAFGQAQWHSLLGRQWQLLMSGKLTWSSTDYKNEKPTGGASSARYLQREAYISAALSYKPTNWLSMCYASDYIWNGMNHTIQLNGSPRRNTFLQSLTAKMQWPRLSITARTLSTLIPHASISSTNKEYSKETEKEKVSGEERFGGMGWQRASSSGGRFGGGFTLSYQLLPHKQLFFRTSWKSIFRIPSFNELYFYHIGSSDLKPEHTQQWNVGLTWEYHIGQTFSIAATADLYWNKVKDKIIGIPFNMFIWRRMNMAMTKAHGIDLTTDISWQPHNQHTLGLTVNYSRQRVENRTNPESPNYRNQIAYIPEHSYAVSFSWANPWVNLSVTNDGISHRWTTNEHAASTRLAGYAETDLGLWRTFYLKCPIANHKPITNKQKTFITIRASLLNIFDKQYEIVAHYPMPGRSWRITFTINY